MNPRLTLSNLTLGYDGRILVQNACAGFRSGELCVLAGRNGTGKSTLLRAMCGLQPLLSGSVLIDGCSISAMKQRRRAECVAFVSTQRIRVTDMLVSDAVALGRAPYTGWLGRLSDADSQAVEQALEAVEMTDFAAKRLDTLSDGEYQRVMIARALAQDTGVLLLDEPTAFLDVPNRYQICALLWRLARSHGRTVIFSSHELTVASRMCDTMALIENKSLLYGPAEQMMASEAMQRLLDGAPLTESCAAPENQKNTFFP